VACESDRGPRELILASASKGRADLLRQAGLRFAQRPADIDERAVEADAALDGAADIALLLAMAKAEKVSRSAPEAVVIGADQVMECGGRLFQKPPTIEAARDQLEILKGKTHSLHAGVAVAQDGRTRWRHQARADLTMRDFSDAFLEEYCRAEGEAMLASVGAYRIEGPGIQLFSDIRGDYFTIIGLPLLPLLGYLRECGFLTA